MSINNKLGEGSYLKIIIALPILILASMIGTIGLLDIGDDLIISNIYDVTKDVANDTGVSSNFKNTIDETKTNYDETIIPFDLIFAMIMLSAFAASIFVASKSQPLPTFSFLGYSTIGLMFVLLIIVFLDQFVTWFINEFFYKLFDGATQDTPFLDWYFANLSLISIVWFAILLFMNQVEIDIKRIFRKDSKDDVQGNVEE